jgi:hypothetical protein
MSLSFLIFDANGSGQSQEQLFQLSFGQWRPTAYAATGDALSKTRRDDLEPGSVKCARHRRELGHYVLAVPALLDHRDHASELALRAPQPIEHRSDAVLVTSHISSSG